MFYSIMIRLAYPFMWLIFRPKITGKENIKKLQKQGFIAMANHTSYRDPPLIAMLVAPRHLFFMAKKELFHGFFGKLISSVGAFPVDREGSDTHAIRRAMELVSQNEVCLMFPEGTRSTDGELLPFEKGVAFVTWKCKAPVLPIYIQPGWKRGRVWISVGEPIDVVDVAKKFDSRERLQGISTELYQEIVTLKEKQEECK